MGSDVSGYKAIIINDSGSRNPFNKNSLAVVDYGDGIKKNHCELALDSIDVFSFGIMQAPKSVNKLMTFADLKTKEINFAVFIKPIK